MCSQRVGYNEKYGCELCVQNKTCKGKCLYKAEFEGYNNYTEYEQAGGFSQFKRLFLEVQDDDK